MTLYLKGKAIFHVGGTINPHNPQAFFDLDNALAEDFSNGNFSDYFYRGYAAFTMMSISSSPVFLRP